VVDERDRLRRFRQIEAEQPKAKPVTADADPLAALQKSIAESKAQVEKKNIEIPTIALEQAINTGDTAAAATAAGKLADAEGVTGAAKTAAIGNARKDAQQTVESDRELSKPTEDPGNGNIWSYSVAEGRWKRVKVSEGKTEQQLLLDSLSGDGTPENPYRYKKDGSLYNGSIGFADYVNGVLKQSGSKTDVAEVGDKSSTSIFGSVEGTSTTRTLGRDQFKNSLALFFGAAEAAKPWVDALYDVVSKFYRTGSDVNESFNLALQDARNNPALKPFTDRFKGIYALQDLKLTGKPVLVPTIAEYVVSQAKMADVLNQANLGSIATDEFTTELISKGNSVTTIAEKIAKVYQRIDMAPRAIKDTLSRFFPTVDRTTLAKTLLTGQKGVDQLVDELEQYEVLAAAEGQGLGAINRIGGVDLGRAQEYARSGQTFTSLTPQFSRIARALPTTTKLSEISKLEDIGQIGLEKALISQSAKELEQLEELGEQEMARYSGKAGRAELGLASQRRANRAF
jgi:hypothetical protein